MKPRAGKLVMLLSVFFFQFHICHAWGPTTHIALTSKVVSQLSGPMTRDEELKNIILSTSMGPDFSGLGEAYHVWHDPDFVVALQRVALTLEGREKDRLLATTYGWNSHIQGDSVGHEWSGYPNAKKIFKRLPDGNYLPSHISTEFSVGLLDYRENPGVIDGVTFYMPPVKEFLAAVEVYKNIKEEKGENDQAAFSYTSEQYASDVGEAEKRFMAEKATFRNIINNRPGLLPQLEKKFADRGTGVNGIGGIDASLKAVKNGFISLDKNTPLPQEMSAKDRAALNVTLQNEQIGNAIVSKVGDVLVGAVGRQKLDKMIDADKTSENAVYLKYIRGLALEKQLDLEDIIKISQSDFSVSSSNLELLSKARDELEVSIKRVKGIKDKIAKKSFLGKVVKFIFGDGDDASLAAAENDLAAKEAAVAELENKISAAAAPKLSSDTIQLPVDIIPDKHTDY